LSAGASPSARNPGGAGDAQAKALLVPGHTSRGLA